MKENTTIEKTSKKEEKKIYEILIEGLEKQISEDDNTYNIHIMNALKELKIDFDWFLIQLFHPKADINGVKNYHNIIDGYNKYLKLKGKLTCLLEDTELEERGFDIRN